MPDLTWAVPLHEKPSAALMAFGTHGPRLTDRMRSERHWWLHLYAYRATLRLNGQSFSIRPGTVSLIAPGVEIEYDFGERATHLCAHFILSPPHKNPLSVPPLLVPAVQDAGEAFPALYAALEDAAACFAVNPLRAEVRLWDILWQLAGPPHAEPPHHAYPAAVAQARQFIERRLAETLSVKNLAEEVGVSHNHLTRLFRATVGDTVVGYIRGRRVERACHLLKHTTLPVKTVAAQVGVEDVRLFYKLLRARTGCSPTQVRQAARLSENT